MLGVRSVCLKPRRLNGAHLNDLMTLQPILHKLYDAVARDVDFVSHAIRSCIPRCAWQEKELDIFQMTATQAAEKPRLLLPNSVFLQPNERSSTLIVGNVQAGEPFHVELLHGELRQTLSQPVEPGPLHAHCDAIATAAKLIHPHAPCVAILTKPKGALAQRTSTDVKGVGKTLLESYGMHTVIYVSMQDLAAAIIDADGHLKLGDHRISVVYSRYDFSHPFGCPQQGSEILQSVGESTDGSAGSSQTSMGSDRTYQVRGNDCSDRERLNLLWQEWQTIATMERSSAVISSDLGCRLAHRRSVAYALAQPGGVERFLTDEREVAGVRAVLPEQWSLRSCYPQSFESAMTLVKADPGDFIAKNILRPRTGSGATQDRYASGGMPVLGAADVLKLIGDECKREWYLLYQRLDPITHAATVRNTNHSIHCLQRAVSEVAVYGAYLTMPGEDVPVINTSAGVAARTRPDDATDPVAASLGYGALSCVAAY